MWPIAIVGHLKPGWEDIGEIADRLGRFFESLAEVDPLFRHWMRAGVTRHQSVVPALVTIPPEQTELRAWVDESRVYGSREGRKATVGYSLRALTPEQNPIRADFWPGYQPGDWWFSRRLAVTIFSGAASPSPLDDPSNPQALVALLRAVLLVVGSAWDCDWAGLSPGDYRSANERAPNARLAKYQSGWMVYLDPATAISIVPPHDIAIESLPNGGMLLIATPNAMFNGRNSDHRAAALRIQAALEPLNAAHSE
jgi:hypothetical protein